MNRHHFFLIGLIVLYVGLQFRFVESYVLNEKSSRFLAQRLGSAPEAPAINMIGLTQRILPGATTSAQRTMTPPEWIGWALISIGSVLVLHSLAMPKPGAG
jgi:hypothetical protein